MLYRDGSEYVGEWQHDRKHGYGRESFFRDGELGAIVFEGFYNKGMYKSGTLQWKNQGRYVGDFVDNLYSNGTFFEVNGDVHVGEWKDNKRNGQGIYTFADNDTENRVQFEGIYKDDVWKVGTLTWKSGEKYSGEFVNLERSGNGTNDYPNGLTYTGEWRYDNWHGHGKIIYPNDDDRESFEGDFEYGEKKNGTLIWKNKEKYVGEFGDDVPAGSGILYYSNGNEYIGEWLEGKRQGQGTLYSSNGDKLNDGKWQNDSFVD